MATTVVLHDEGTRRVIEAVLWDYACSAVTHGETLDNDLSSLGVAVLGRYDFGTREELLPTVDLRIEQLSVLRREIDRLRSAEIGESFVVPMSAEELDSELRDHLIPTIEEFEGFWGQPAGDRDRMLASRDAAARLRAELAVGEALLQRQEGGE
ncbi:MAG: hypothetical protein M3071_23790 [Actinomycetota bacterium]|nr:hypothetical protein [Actinomycetota bacterium]